MIRTATRTRPHKHESRNGDRAIVRAEGARTLITVVDALGHGPIAADVSDRVESVLVDVPLERGLGHLFAESHKALRGTRGAAMTALLVEGAAFEAAGVGNVALRSRAAGISVVPMPGIVGVRMRTPRTFRAELARPVRLVLHSDGISSRFDLAAFDGLDTDAAADALFERHAQDHDDATLVVVDVQ